MLTDFNRYFPLFSLNINWKTLKKNYQYFCSALPTYESTCCKVTYMHKLVFVLLEPQWTLNTEVLNYQCHYPTLFGLSHCSNPESHTFHLVWRSNTVAEVLLWKHLIKMRFMPSRWNTTVLILLDFSYCCSAPLPCTLQARSQASLDVSAYRSAWTYKPCLTCWHSHTALHRHAQYQLLAWRSLSLPFRCPVLMRWSPNPEEVGHPVWDPVA